MPEELTSHSFSSLLSSFYFSFKKKKKKKTKMKEKKSVENTRNPPNLSRFTDKHVICRLTHVKLNEGKQERKKGGGEGRERE